MNRKEFAEISKMIIKDFYEEVKYFVKSNLMFFGHVLNVMLVYGMYYIGMISCQQRGRIKVGIEIVIPILVMALSSFCKSFANKIGKGSIVPIPMKRFTEYDEESGEVTVEKNRIQEMILYVADVEDWLERKGMLNK